MLLSRLRTSSEHTLKSTTDKEAKTKSRQTHSLDSRSVMMTKKRLIIQIQEEVEDVEVIVAVEVEEAGAVVLTPTPSKILKASILAFILGRSIR